MRTLITLLLLLSVKTFAQTNPENKSIQDIALMERLSHQRIAAAANATLASNNFDVKYYRCEWEVDPAIRYIKGKVTVYYVVTAATNSIVLDLMNALTVDSVKQRSLLLTKSQSNNTLTINFPGTANAGTLDSVSIFYQGVPPDTGFGSFVTSTHNGTPVMWSLSEPYGSRDWWPCKNGLDDKADSIDVLITHPSAYKAASNGLLQSQTLVSGGSKLITHWKHRYAIASYLICFAVTNYSVFNNTVQLSTGILPMQTYCYPENLSSFQGGTINTLNAMQLYDTTFGPYPFMNEKYGHVQFGWGGGMEHQTATFVVNIGESLCAHELAHQWFGDKITCGSWKDIWLNEGFATHLASLYMEKKYPSSVVSNRKSEINTITSQPGGSVLVDDTTNVNRIFDDRLSYTKGSHLLYMLRWILGDNAFFTALRNYQTDPAIVYGFATTADLKRHLEQTSGRNLTYFFNEWYSGQGYPTYNVQWSNAGSGNVWIKMNQVASHSSVTFFELPVALQFKNATQQATVVVNNTSNGEIFFKSIGFVPDAVIIDPDAWLITRNNTSAQLPTCGTVSGLTSSAVSTNTATVSWSALSGSNNYDVDYKLASSATWTNAATATTSLSVNLSGLTAGSLYDWRVKANCTFEGPYAQAQFTTSATATCGTVTGLTSSAITSSTAIVSWSALSGSNN
ncbi:MAG: fibronectin type III domain-containing protein, partial [Flavisolibacter sp.]|nr:fibronectin type III domain-containing protein [Flavisolibacter sp.]